MVPKTGKLGRELRGALKEAVFFISLALRALKFWRKDPPVLNVVDLARFADSRAKFATQTTLFGYIKTRVVPNLAVMVHNTLLHTVSVDAAAQRVRG